jgi:hypothetical protein
VDVTTSYYVTREPGDGFVGLYMLGEIARMLAARELQESLYAAEADGRSFDEFRKAGAGRWRTLAELITEQPVLDSLVASLRDLGPPDLAELITEQPVLDALASQRAQHADLEEANRMEESREMVATYRGAAMTVTEREIMLFVGSEAGYYLKAWRPRFEGRRAALGLNGSAFLMAGLWLLYRKMYTPALAFFGIVFATRIVEELICVGGLGLKEVPFPVPYVIPAVGWFVCAICGNGWYFNHTMGAIDKIRERGLRGAEYEKALAKKGGTSLGMALGITVALILARVLLLGASAAGIGKR